MAVSIKTRIIWHMHRTPAAALVKSVLRLWRGAACAHRKRLSVALRRLPGVPELGAQLNAIGFADVTSVVDPVVLKNLANHASEKIDRKEALRKSQVMAHKGFWVRLSDEDLQDNQFWSGSPLVQYAVQPSVLAVIATAFGELPQLSDVLYTHSEHSAAAYSYSQLWHRDYDDVRTVKLFVYLTDVVSERDGPFTFIDGPASDRLRFSKRTHMRDEDVFDVIPRSVVRQLMLPKLSTFLVETSRCLHMGSRIAEGHSRLLYTATFIKFPRVYPEPPPRFSGVEHLSEVHRTVLSPI